MATEALYYQLAGQCLGVTVPAVVAVDGADAAGGYLVMTECPGTPGRNWRPSPRGAERDELRAALGGQVARLHTITGTGFGYPSESVGPLRDSWREAFLDMVHAVLADAETFAVTLPRPVADVLEWFDARAPALDEVTTPVLVHFDLWDGNILVESDRGRAPDQRPDRRGASVLGRSAGGVRTRWRCSGTSSGTPRSWTGTGPAAARRPSTSRRGSGFRSTGRTCT